MGRRATVVLVSDRQREILESWVRAHKTRKSIGVRARIVLMCAEQVPTWKQVLELKTDFQRVSRWRVRWGQWQERLAAAESKGATVKELRALILRALSDAPRSGVTPKFSPEQLAQLISLACEHPKDSGLPVSHWTPTELAREAMKRGIVESISARHIDRFLKRSQDQTAQESVLAHIAGQAGGPRALQARRGGDLRYVSAGSATRSGRDACGEHRRKNRDASPRTEPPHAPHATGIG